MENQADNQIEKGQRNRGYSPCYDEDLPALAYFRTRGLEPFRIQNTRYTAHILSESLSWRQAPEMEDACLLLMGSTSTPLYTTPLGSPLNEAYLGIIRLS